MSELIDSVTADLRTDFSLLSAIQERVLPGDLMADFAASSPGVVALQAGTKYPRISIRAERWDGPPPLTDEWEDIDELPFEEVPSGGLLILSGFDTGDVGLDVSGVGLGRVQVMARGRHRYHYGSHVDTEAMDPEEWLLRVYPLPGPVDPMSGPPRRLAAGGSSQPPRTPWMSATLGFRTTGWSDTLNASHGFYLARLALMSAEPPLTRLRLAQLMAQRMAPWEVGDDNAETLEVEPRPSLFGAEDPLVTYSGHPRAATIGDAIDCLVALGLVLIEERGVERLVVPNPAPQPSWEHPASPEQRRAWARTRALEDDHRASAMIIEGAVAWLRENGLTATPRAMSIRWAFSVEDIAGALRLLCGSGRVTADRELGFDSEIDPDEAITLVQRSAST